jgi:hypothetical protein
MVDEKSLVDGFSTKICTFADSIDTFFVSKN